MWSYYPRVVWFPVPDFLAFFNLSETCVRHDLIVGFLKMHGTPKEDGSYGSLGFQGDEIMTWLRSESLHAERAVAHLRATARTVLIDWLLSELN